MELNSGHHSTEPRPILSVPFLEPAIFTSICRALLLARWEISVVPGMGKRDRIHDTLMPKKVTAIAHLSAAGSCICSRPLWLGGPAFWNRDVRARTPTGLSVKWHHNISCRSFAAQGQASANTGNSSTTEVDGGTPTQARSCPVYRCERLSTFDPRSYPDVSAPVLSNPGSTEFRSANRAGPCVLRDTPGSPGAVP
jgi:hypothetical protein